MRWPVRSRSATTTSARSRARRRRTACSHWSGTIDPHGLNGGPATFNPDDYLPVFTWTTYPERLQAAGISWQVYANDEVGDGGGEDGYVGDYGDNPLWLFQAYHDALASTDPAVRQLAEQASLRTAWKPNSGLGLDVNHVLAQFIADATADNLPQVSWIVAPYAYSEHPQARPVERVARRYTQTVLNAMLVDAGALGEDGRVHQLRRARRVLQDHVHLADRRHPAPRTSGSAGCPSDSGHGFR